MIFLYIVLPTIIIFILWIVYEAGYSKGCAECLKNIDNET